jgi:dihydrofolate reductase
MEKSMIRAILACDDDWGIGKDGDLPWPHNPADLRWFKENTTGGVVAMGKATWDSLPKKPLPDRNNIVITTSEKDKDGPYHFLTFNKAKSYLVSMSQIQDVWVIGGAKLVEGLLPIIEEVWLSRIQGSYNCDTFLPATLIEETLSLTSSGLQNDVYVDIWSRV